MELKLLHNIPDQQQDVFPLMYSENKRQIEVLLCDGIMVIMKIISIY